MIPSAGFSRRSLLAAAVAGVCTFAAHPLLAEDRPAPTRPNVILILLDDLSAKELTPYGGAGITTPHIDRLAADGVCFKTAWATPVCGPSRAMLFTGRYATQTRFWDNAVFPRRPIWENHLMLSRVLRDSGYATGMYGKAHFGEDPKTDLGFSDYCICRTWPGYTGKPQGLNNAKTGMYAGQWYYHPALVANDKGIKTSPDDFGPDIEVQHLLAFIDKNKQRPFFAYWATNLPHKQYSPEAKWHYTDVPELTPDGTPTGKRVPGSLKSNVEYADHLIGKILSALTTAGVLDNTLVIITADNGTADYGKNVLTSEVGPRVPFIVAGPGVKKQGPSDHLVSLADVFPTLVELCGAKVRADYDFNGASFARALRGERGKGRNWLYSHLASGTWIRNDRWLKDAAGNFWDCGTNRDETKGYKDVTNSTDPEVINAKRTFADILASMPKPDPNDKAIGPALRRAEVTLGLRKN